MLLLRVVNVLYTCQRQFSGALVLIEVNGGYGITLPR